MKRILATLIVMLVFLAIVPEAAAQRKRADKTSSAKAYYGQTPSRPDQRKQKKMTSVKTYRSHHSKRAKAEARNRKRYS